MSESLELKSFYPAFYGIYNEISNQVASEKPRDRDELMAIAGYKINLNRISQLEKENAELKCRLDEIKLYIPKIGETLKLTEKDKLIVELKEELARERECVDFYGDKQNWSDSYLEIDDEEWVGNDKNSDDLWENTDKHAGKRARQRIKERKEFE